MEMLVETFHLESTIEIFTLIAAFCKWYFIILMIFLAVITGVVIFVNTYKELCVMLKKQWLVYLISFIVGLFSGLFAAPIMLVTMFVAPYDF